MRKKFQQNKAYNGALDETKVRFYRHSNICFGADQVSTWVTKQRSAYRGSDYLVNTAEQV